MNIFPDFPLPSGSDETAPVSKLTADPQQQTEWLRGKAAGAAIKSNTMKHPYITHLPHPRSSEWTLVTLAIYGGSAIVMLSMCIIAWVILK